MEKININPVKDFFDGVPAAPLPPTIGVMLSDFFELFNLLKYMGKKKPKRKPKPRY